MNSAPTNAATAAAATNSQSNGAVPANVAATGAAAVSCALEDDNSPVSLHAEISNIMRSYGDSNQPRPESVSLVQHILKQQMRGIFNEASMVAMQRINKPCPSQEDFEFLMRSHPMKIARLRQHLLDVRTLTKFLTVSSGRPQDYMESSDLDTDEELPIEMPEMDDEVRIRRMVRADRVSQLLTGEQYLEFNEARKTAFYSRRGEKIKTKFRRFLELPADLKIPITTMNILAHLAHETIAVIVDYAILTRLNSSNRITEPYSLSTSVETPPSMMYICPEVTQGRGREVEQAITVQEIHEAIRRFRQMTSKKMGFYRSSGTSRTDLKSSYLAL